jgi:hypothetical protein
MSSSTRRYHTNTHQYLPPGYVHDIIAGYDSIIMQRHPPDDSVSSNPPRVGLSILNAES